MSLPEDTQRCTYLMRAVKFARAAAPTKANDRFIQRAVAELEQIEARALATMQSWFSEWDQAERNQA
jgi:hypothetical protein